VANTQPALWRSETAGYSGPYLSLSSSNATPKYCPSIAKDKVPLFILRNTPKTPYLLKGFPYLGPTEFELCLSWPTPKNAQP
jgi:hypothetical protein